MVPQWFKTPVGRSYGAAAAAVGSRKPLPAPGDCGSLVAKHLTGFNRFDGAGGPEPAVFLGFRGRERGEPGRQRRPVAGDGQRLEASRVAGHQRDRRFGDPERLAQEDRHRRIGFALVGHGSDPDPEDSAAVVTRLDAVDPVGAGIGRDAQVERQPIGGDAPGAQ